MKTYSFIFFFLGTTLNLLKFPIINPTPYRLFRRAERLRLAAQQTEDDLDPEELRRIQHFRKQGYLIGELEQETVLVEHAERLLIMCIHKVLFRFMTHSLIL